MVMRNYWYPGHQGAQLIIFVLLMKLPLKVQCSFGIYYSTPTGLSGLWSFGVGALIFFVVQLVTGLLLVSNYIPYIIYAPSSIEQMTASNTICYNNICLVQALQKRTRKFSRFFRKFALKLQN